MPLAYVGIAVTIGNWLIVTFNVVQLPPQLWRAIVSGIGLVILAPIWYIWLGLRLRQAG